MDRGLAVTDSPLQDQVPRLQKVLKAFEEVSGPPLFTIALHLPGAQPCSGRSQCSEAQGVWTEDPRAVTAGHVWAPVQIRRLVAPSRVLSHLLQLKGGLSDLSSNTASPDAGFASPGVGEAGERPPS